MRKYGNDIAIENLVRGFCQEERRFIERLTPRTLHGQGRGRRIRAAKERRRYEIMDDDFDNCSEPSGSCDECCCNLYTDDEIETGLCDQCQFYKDSPNAHE